MTSAVTARTPSPPSSAELQRFQRFCGLIGLPLEPFQEQIAAEAFADARELLVLIPRGNGKTTICAALALFHLLTEPRPAAYVAAASRDQARILFEQARDFARHPLIAPKITTRHLELRVPGGYLRVLASDAPKVHGLTPSLALVDELHAHKDAELYLALLTAMLKRPGARMVTISTAGFDAASALGKLRTRALALPSVATAGTLTRAAGPTLTMLDWAVPDDGDVDDPSVVKAANPASWITRQGLAEQREAVHDLAFRRYHANQWTTGDRSWLPAGAWTACADSYRIDPGERVWLGVDVGGERSATAAVWLTEDLRIGSKVFHGDRAVLEVAAYAREIAATYEVVEFVHDPWRAQQMALELEADGLTVVQFPQSAARMIPASERLYRAVIEGRIRHPDDPDLNAHVASAVARDTSRGWRLDKSHRSAQIDAVIALAMALERAEHRPEPVELLGWV